VRLLTSQSEHPRNGDLLTWVNHVEPLGEMLQEAIGDNRSMGASTHLIHINTSRII